MHWLGSVIARCQTCQDAAAIDKLTTSAQLFDKINATIQPNTVLQADMLNANVYVLYTSLKLETDQPSEAKLALCTSIA
jgi:hypothetical protein